MNLSINLYSADVYPFKTDFIAKLSNQDDLKTQRLFAVWRERNLKNTYLYFFMRNTFTGYLVRNKEINNS